MAQTVRESVASGRRAPYSRGRCGQKKSAPVSAAERRRLFQLVACGGMFVLLVTVKLLLPGKLDVISEKVNAALRQNMDIQAVFSAIGGAASGQQDVGQALDEMYEAVFHPDTFSAYETAAKSTDLQEEPAAMEHLRNARTEEAADGVQEQEETAEVSTLAYVLYSNQNLPENVCMEQCLLGFDYCTPADGPISSGFGYRDHPVEGEERFHYGVDIAAPDGSDVCCFADGTVKAAGESSSYGKYVIVTHEGGYETLYAHCSAISVTSGAQVGKGSVLGKVGQTGIATGPHLHFELHQEGVYLNPVYYVSAA